MKQLDIALIRIDGGTQSRAKLNQAVISSYAKAMAAGAIFPPVVAFFDGQDYWLADGFHRLAATQKLGKQTLAAEIRQGSQRDAILFAAGVNTTHGLRRTNADKRQAVTLLLTDLEWQQWSDREIARRCGVSDRLVNKLRKQRSANNSQMQTEPTNRNVLRKVKRNNTIYTINTANIGQGSLQDQQVPLSPEMTADSPDLEQQRQSLIRVLHLEFTQMEPAQENIETVVITSPSLHAELETNPSVINVLLCKLKRNPELLPTLLRLLNDAMT